MPRMHAGPRGLLDRLAPRAPKWAWASWGCGLLVMTTIALVATWLADGFTREAAPLAQALHTAAPASLPAAPAQPGDFTDRLGSPAAAEPVIGDLRAAADRAAVAIRSVAATHRAPRPDSLGHIELSVVLRGDYAATKALLGELLDRHHRLSVASLRLHRIDGEHDIETKLALSLWSAPGPRPPPGLAVAANR